MAKNNKECICCGTKYSYCNTCSADRDKPTWMRNYCSDNCRKLFNTASDYFAKAITKEDAKKIIDSADLSKMSSFNKGVIQMINEVKMIQNDSFKKSVNEANKNSENIKTESNEKENNEKHNKFERQMKKND